MSIFGLYIDARLRDTRRETLACPVSRSPVSRVKKITVVGF